MNLQKVLIYLLLEWLKGSLGSNLNRDLEVQNFQQQVTKVSVTGLDCSNPIETIFSSKEHMCESQPVIDQSNKTKVDVLIIQKVPFRKRKAYTCLKFVSELDVHCGYWSYAKIQAPMTIRQPSPVSPGDCMNAVQNNQLITEHGTRLSIKKNQAVFYKYVKHGTLVSSTNNVQCNPDDQLTIDGVVITGAIGLVTVEFRLAEVTLQETKSSVLDVQNDFYLPRDCMDKNACQIADHTYVFLKPIKKEKQDCMYTHVRTLNMDIIKIHGQEHYLSASHKLLLKKGSPVIRGSDDCQPLLNLHTTQIDEIFTLSSETHSHKDLFRVANHLGEIMGWENYDYNPRIEEKIVVSYNSYYLATKLSHKFKKLQQQICEDNTRNLEPTKMSPFHKNTIIEVKGDLLVETRCKPVKFWINLSPETKNQTCYNEHIMVWNDHNPHLLHIPTRVITTSPSKLLETKCERKKQYIIAQNYVIDAYPYPQVANVKLDHWNTSIFDCDELDLHHDDEEETLYTQKEKDSANQARLHHEGRKYMTNIFYSSWCSEQDDGFCGNQQAMDHHPSISTWNRLLSLSPTYNWFLRIKNWIQNFGSTCSVFITLYILISGAYKLIKIMIYKFKGKHSNNETAQQNVNINLPQLITPLWQEGQRNSRFISNVSHEHLAIEN